MDQWFPKARGRSSPRTCAPGPKRRPGVAREPNGRASRVRPECIEGRAFVYVMTQENKGGTKIGFSERPKSRVAALQSGCAEVLCLFWTVELEAEVARRVEFMVHRELRGTSGHRRGEWYYLSPPTCVKVVENIIERLGAAKIPA